MKYLFWDIFRYSNRVSKIFISECFRISSRDFSSNLSWDFSVWDTSSNTPKDYSSNCSRNGFNDFFRDYFKNSSEITAQILRGILPTIFIQNLLIFLQFSDIFLYRCLQVCKSFSIDFFLVASRNSLSFTCFSKISPTVSLWFTVFTGFFSGSSCKKYFWDSIKNFYRVFLNSSLSAAVFE